MKLEKKRWMILIASCLINLCIGSMYAWSVFATPMAEYLNGINGFTGNAALTAGSLAIVFTVANAVGPISMISGGFFNERFGPKWVIFAGGMIFGTGLLLSGFVTNPGMLAGTYGVGCGLGMGFVYGCTISNTVKFFPDKRGLAGGIATAFYGLSSVIVPPIANNMIAKYGVIATFRGMGLLFMLVIGVCSMFIMKCPDGYIPEGWNQIASSSKENRANDKNWKQMIRDKNFYLMIFILMCGAFSGLMMISQVSPMAQSIIGITPAVAAIIVSILALFNASGRILSGMLSDKIGRINTLTIVFILSIVSLIVLSVCAKGDLIFFAAATALIGFCFGSYMGIFPGFTADQFGAKYNSVNYGIMFIGFSLAGMLGPMAAGKIVAAYGTYQNAFYIAMAFCAIGIILTFLYRKKNRLN